MGVVGLRDDLRQPAGEPLMSSSAAAVVTRLVSAMSVAPGATSADELKVKALRYLLIDLDRCVSRLGSGVGAQGFGGLRQALCEMVARSWERGLCGTDLDVSEQIDAVCRVIKIDDPQGPLAQALLRLDEPGSPEEFDARLARQAAWVLYDYVTHPSVNDGAGVVLSFERRPAQVVSALLPRCVDVVGAEGCSADLMLAAQLLGSEYLAIALACKQELESCPADLRSELSLKWAKGFDELVVEPAVARASDNMLAIEGGVVAAVKLLGRRDPPGGACAVSQEVKGVGDE